MDIGVEPERAEQQQGVRAWHAILALVLYLALNIVGGLVVTALLFPAALQDAQALQALVDSPEAGLALTGVAGVAALAAAALFVRRGRRTALGLVAASPAWLAVGVGAGLAGWLANRGVVWLYMTVTGDTSNPQAGLAAAASETPLAGFLLLVALGGLLVPIGEELLFRGLLYGWLRRWGVPLAVVGSALVFGVFHGFNVVLPAAVVLGVLLAAVRERSGSIWPAVVGHAANNILLFVLARVLL